MNSEQTLNNKNDVQNLLNKGFEAHARHKFDEAAAYCRQILEINPNIAPAHFLIGLVSLGKNDHNSALNAFLRVLDIDNKHVASWAQLAHIYMLNGEITLADKALHNTFQLNTDDPLVLDLIGKTLTLMGDHELAKQAFGRAHTLVPANMEYAYNLATNLIYHGETDDAVALFRLILKQKPDSAYSHWSIAFAQKAKDMSHIEEMQKNLAGNKDLSSVAFYNYAIGKEFEDLEQWDEAFQAYSIGAKARRSNIKYDENTEIKVFDYLTENFTKEWLEKSAPGISDASPIFVLGQPRTGTTLIERIISSHSDVHSAGELQQFPLAIKRLANITTSHQFSMGLFEKALQIDAVQLGQLYINTTARMTGNKPKFVDKFPLNYLYLPLILKALPKAKIIHLTRNPMDACFSSFKQYFAETYLHSYDQEEMARHHVRYRKLMQTWREEFPDRFYDISYEEAVQDVESNARGLLSYLELPWQDECLNFHKQSSTVTTASSLQVREPAHTRSIGRWLKYEKNLQPMLKVLNENGIF